MNRSTPEQIQSPSFLTTLQSSIAILDDISPLIEENDYLTLANNLQQLYTIHTLSLSSLSPTSPTSPTNPTSTIPANTMSSPSIYFSNTNNDYSDYSQYINTDISNNYVTRTRSESLSSDIQNMNDTNDTNDNNIRNNNLINSMHWLRNIPIPIHLDRN